MWVGVSLNVDDGLSDNFFIIDIENCPDPEYAFIDFLYKYKSITEVTPCMNWWFDLIE